MHFENVETKELYNYICKKYKIAFVIYKNRYEKVTYDEILNFVSDFIKNKKRS